MYIIVTIVYTNPGVFVPNPVSYWFPSEQMITLGDDALGVFALPFITHTLYIYMYVLNYRVHDIFDIVKYFCGF